MNANSFRPGPSRCGRWMCAALGLAVWALACEHRAAGREGPEPGPESRDLARVRADESRRCDVLARAARAVVCVFADVDAGVGGSGVVIDPQGFGLTNFHVVQPFVDSRKGYGGLSDGKLYPLRLLGIDPGGDVALFKLEGKEHFDYAPLGDSDAVRVGQPVVAMGNPFLLAEDFTPTITMGIVSGLHRYQAGQGRSGSLLEYADCIQVSSSINPGNSGGPLFDLDGRLIGINGRASFEERGRVNVGLGYAITINQIRRFLPCLRAGRLCEHGALGATVQMAGEDLVVNAIQSFSPAEQAGLQLGDQVLAFCGQPLRTPNEFLNRLAILPAGWPVQLTVRRDGVLLTVHARLERLPLRVPAPWVPDREHNRAEVRRLLRELAAAGGATAVLRWRARLESDGQIGEHELTSGPRPPTPVRPPPRPAAGEAALRPSEELAQEWARLTAPLHADLARLEEWELLGGDEVDGQVVWVVQQRADQALTQWKFDEDGRLREVVLDWLPAGESVESTSGAVIWQAAAERLSDPRGWPAAWTRRSGDQTQRVEILSVRRGAPSGGTGGRP